METLKNGNAAQERNEADGHEKQRHFTKWLNKMVSDVAHEMGISLTKVQYVDGRRLGCRDAHLLKITAQGNLVSTIIHNGEFRTDAGPDYSERARCRIRDVLTPLLRHAD